MTESLSLITREIPLTKGKVTIVDAGDYEFLSQWNWFSLNDYYAARTKYIGMFNGKPKRITIKMHQVLMNAPEGFEIDHINGDGLDNRRSNLRICTHQQNIWNRRAQKGSTSKYKGVSFQASTQYWKAYISIDGGKQKHLGCYLNEEGAARAYNKAAKKYHGEFARLNSVEGEPPSSLKHPVQYKYHDSRKVDYV